MKNIGILMIVMGCVLIVIGIGFVFSKYIPWFGNLPGDINYRGKSVCFSFPVVTCIIISIIMTILVNLFLKLFPK
jgi:hypothetical protein